MADRIPLCGIDAYMAGMVREQAPGNRMAPVAAWFASGWSALACLIVLVILATWFWHIGVGGTFMPNAPHMLESYTLAALVVGAGFLSLQVLTRSLSREPGVWRSYSVSEFVNAYDTAHPQLETEVAAVRSRYPLAEFELAVLHSEDSERPIGMVLFRVDDLYAQSALSTREPIRIYDGEGRALEFGLAYAPFGSETVPA